MVPVGRKGADEPGVSVRALASGELPAYAALARDCASVFHTPEWTGLFGDRLLRFGIFGASGELIGGFHAYKERRLGVTLLRNPPFTPECGPFFKPRVGSEVLALEARRDILAAMADYLDENMPGVLSLSLGRGIDDTLPFVWRKFKVVPGYTYVLDLSRPLEEIKSRMSSGRRGNISKAARDGLVVQSTTDLRIIRDLVGQTFARRELDEAARHLDDVLFRFANNDNSYSFTTYRNGEPVAACFVVHDSSTAFYLLAGSSNDEKHHGAGPLAVAEAIAHAQALGLRAFDFEGSMIPSIERYFRGFGGRLTPYFTINKAWLPLECGLKLVKRERF